MKHASWWVVVVVCTLSNSPAVGILNIRCTEVIVDIYNSVVVGQNAKDRKWCIETMRKHGTVMSKDIQNMWTSSKCEEQIIFDRIMSYNRRLGWYFLSNWLKQRYKNKSSPNDGIECASSYKANSFCRLSNTTLDFSKVRVGSDDRSFALGFVTSYGSSNTDIKPAPGYRHLSTGSLRSEDVPAMADCDEWEERPTFVLSNDDPFNLSHYMNDVMMMWSMLVLAGRSGKDSLLINMDGIRSGGPAGGLPHRLMAPGNPDAHGPFSAYYESWFGELKKGSDYDKKKVCFREVYFQYFPSVPWFWEDWFMDNPYSFMGPSPLYQSFSLHLRESWRAHYGEESLPSPPTDSVHVVIEVRQFNRKKDYLYHSGSRVIANLDKLVSEIESIPGVTLTVQSFARLPFKQQVALSHSAGVLLTMHGAGTANMFHTAVGSPNCCALIELFPDRTTPFHSIRGFGNLARHMGMHYYRYDAESGDSSMQGTTVDVGGVAQLVRQAVLAVKESPSCLKNASSSTVGLFSSSAVPFSVSMHKVGLLG